MEGKTPLFFTQSTNLPPSLSWVISPHGTVFQQVIPHCSEGPEGSLQRRDGHGMVSLHKHCTLQYELDSRQNLSCTMELYSHCGWDFVKEMPSVTPCVHNTPHNLQLAAAQAKTGL